MDEFKINDTVIPARLASVQRDAAEMPVGLAVAANNAIIPILNTDFTAKVFLIVFLP